MLAIAQVYIPESFSVVDLISREWLDCRVYLGDAPSSVTDVRAPSELPPKGCEILGKKQENQTKENFWVDGVSLSLHSDFMICPGNSQICLGKDGDSSFFHCFSFALLFNSPNGFSRNSAILQKYIFQKLKEYKKKCVVPINRNFSTKMYL